MVKKDTRSTRVSEAPTNPGSRNRKDKFDVASLYEGPLAAGEGEGSADLPLDEKLRQAYFWVVNQAIISPHYDIEYNDGPHQTFKFGHHDVLTLPSGQSYSSYVLLPILTFAARRRCLFVGGPGRGKTASAVLMGVLAGYSIDEVKQAIQRGQPQMTIADLLGNPLPADLVEADSMDKIRISWRKWLNMRVKIIDEYNRIPTRTQSALLTVMGDNYAEILDQVFECPEAAWYLTANDDEGGGTYQVIDALKDRIDVVVKALPFNMRFLDNLLNRIEQGIRPEKVVPPEIVFTEEQADRMHREILEVEIPPELRRRFEFFASNFEFISAGGEQFEYKNKDTVNLSPVDLGVLAAADTARDKLKDLGSQTRNGFSVRALLTAIVYVKAMAYFRGDAEVCLEDMRQVLPFVLHDKLRQNSEAPYFDQPESRVYRVDKISWLRRLFDLSCREYDRLGRDDSDPVAAFEDEFAAGLEGLGEKEVRQRLVAIERTLKDWADGGKVYGHIYDDALKLKYLHQRYSNYLRWVKWQG